jgi:signal transduction histidine kinase
VDLSKVEAGRIELHLEPFNLPSAIESAITLVRERTSRHGITLSLSGGERPSEFVADERKFRQILLNLLSNAVEFTPDGGQVRVDATLAPSCAQISVSDTGTGIAEEDRKAISRHLTRWDAVSSRSEGAGLAITLAETWGKLHGGWIRVESELGKGSTFTFTLPERPWPAN